MAQAGTPTYSSKRFAAAGRGEAWAALDLGMTEAKFQRLVLDLAAWTGWHHRYHTHDSRKSEAGWPDLTLVRRERLIFAELKTQKGRTSAEQRSWIEALRFASQEAYIWTPADWPEIRSILR